MLRLIGFYDYTVILTYLSLCSAIHGMLFACKGKFTAAILCLFFCGVCDAFDGIVARTKKDRTEDGKSFGIQLDSLVDVISFGLFPAALCYFMGVDGVIGVLIGVLYCICAVCRLAYFNVLESNRQKTESGKNKAYRGLPVTSISLIFPLLYLVMKLLPGNICVVLLHLMLAIVAFLFVLDFTVKKPDLGKLLKL